MKVVSLMIASFWAALGVSGFADTGILYSSKKLINDDNESSYITEASQVAKHVQQLTEKACAEGDNGITNHVLIYRVSGLTSGDLEKENDGTFIKHVHYDSAAELDFDLGASCQAGQVRYSELGQVLGQDIAVPVEIVDVEDGKEHSVREFLTSNDGRVIIVQGKPSFLTSASKLEKLKHIVEDKVYENLDIEFDFDTILSKRADRSSEEDDNGKDINELDKEIEDDFKAAESFIAEEGDKLVSIMDDAEEGDSSAPQSPSDGSNVKVNANLFTTYQFFTPGTLLGIIVAGFLVSILYAALSWITSIQITYSSFDKQVDFEKKNE